MMTSTPPCRRCATYRRTFLVPRSSPTIRYVSSNFCRFGAGFLAGPSGMVLFSAAAVVCVDRDFKMRDPCCGPRHGISAAVSCVMRAERGGGVITKERGRRRSSRRSPTSLALLKIKLRNGGICSYRLAEKRIPRCARDDDYLSQDFNPCNPRNPQPCNLVLKTAFLSYG